MQINFKEQGNKGMPIYFIHGNGLNLASMMHFYEGFFQEIKESYRRIYLDIPGMGDSDLGDMIQNLDDVLNQIIECINQTTGKTPFLLCGHSYGGYLCLGIGSKLPIQVKGLFLTCPVVKANKKDRDLEEHINIDIEAVNPKRNVGYFQDFMDMTVIVDKRAWEDYQKAIIPGIKKGINDFWKKIRDDAYSFSFEKELGKNLSKMNGTILLGQYDQIVEYYDQLSFFKELSDIKVCVVKNSGHNLPIDQKAVLRKEFIQFLYFKYNKLT